MANLQVVVRVVHKEADGSPRTSFATRLNDERGDTELRTWEGAFHAWIDAEGNVRAEVIDHRTKQSMPVWFFDGGNGSTVLNVNEAAAYIGERPYVPGIAQKPKSHGAA